MSYCPKCGAEVGAEDAFCRACGASLKDQDEREAVDEPQERSRSRGAGCLIAVVVIAAVVVLFLALPSLGGSSSSTSQPSGLQRANIEVNCQDLVKKHLVSPGTMKVDRQSGAQQLSDGSWTYDFAVDSENGFGALLRSNWHCEVHGTQVTVHQTQ